MTILSAAFLVATIAYLTLAVLIVMRNRRSALNWVCAGVLLCLALWSFTDIFHNDTRLPVERIRFFANLGALGWCSFPSLLFSYSLVLTHRRQALRNWPIYAPLVALPALFAYLQWTGHLGVDYTPQAFGWVTVWARSAWPFVCSAYPLLSAAGAIWVIADYRRRRAGARERRQNLALIITIVVPTVLGAVTNAVLPKLTTIRFPELAGILGLVWAGGLYYSATRYGLLAFSPYAAADEILATMVDSLILLAPDSRIVNVNRATQDLLGYRKSELVGEPGEILFALPGSFRDAAREVAAGKAIRQQKIMALARSGREISTSISARLMRDTNGQAIGSVWVLHDITELRKSEDESRRLAEGLAALNRLAVELTTAPPGLDIYRYLAEQLKTITGAIAVSTAEYDADRREMRIRHLTVEAGLLARVNQLLGKSILSLRMPVTPETYDRVVKGTVGNSGDMTETTFGAVPRPVGSAIQKMLGIDCFTGLAFAHRGELLGTAVISSRTGRPLPAIDVLRTFANIAAVAIRRKRLEDTLRDNEELYRSVIERANDGIVIIQDGVVKYANRRLQKMWGNPGTALTGTQFSDYIDPDERPRIAELYQRRLAGESVPSTYETILRRHDGRQVYVELNAGVIGYEGRPADLVIVRDTSERRQSAVALRDSEENFRTLADRANDAIFISDADGHYAYVNDRAAQITGYAPDELLHLGFRDIIRPRDRAAVGDWGAARLRNEPVPNQYETAIVTKDGREVEVESSVARTWWRGAPANLAVVRDITERKLVDRELQSISAYHRGLIEASPDSLVTIGPDGKIADVNTTTEKMTGYSRDQLIGTDFAGYFTEPERARIGYQQVYRDGFVRDYELQLRHKDGHFTPVRYNATVYRDDQGAVAGVFAAARDIAALRMAESARRESEARYRVLFEHSPIGIYRTTPDGRILMANPALVQILGYASFEELAQRDLEAEGFEPAYDRQQFKADLERQGEIRGKESQWRHRDGSLRFVRENALAVRDDAGKTLYYEGTVEDISDRKRAEAELLALRDRLEEQVRARTAELTLVNAQLQEKIEEHRQVEEQLRESEARFRGVFEKATTGMCLTGPDGRFLDVNESLCQMLEYTHAELAATGFAAVTHPDDLPASRECVRSLLAGERETYHFEKRYVKKSGGVVWTDVSTILIRQPPANGAPRYFITHIHDITERRQTEDRVRQLNRELEATVAQLRTVNQELESFSYSVSHDLRAPLRSLDGFSQALLDDCRNRLDAQGQDYLNRVRAASQRMAQLIDDLLKLSRVTRSELNAESVNLTELARSVMQEIRQANPRPPTPDPEPTVTIAPGLQANGDARLLRILLANLLGNAWKFTSRRTDAAIEFGQISAQEHKRASAQGISPSAQSAGRQPLLTNHYSPLTTFYVRDNGAGFDMAYVGKLFAPFQRLHGIEEFPGSGIGLATAQRIVLRHGGRIWAEGAPGKGASFFFTLGERPTSASQQAARSVAGFNLK